MFLKKCQGKKYINIIARYPILEKFVFNEFKVAMETRWLRDLLLTTATACLLATDQHVNKCMTSCGVSVAFFHFPNKIFFKKFIF